MRALLNLTDTASDKFSNTVDHLGKQGIDQASRLDGWSHRMVIAHVTYVADAYQRMTDDALSVGRSATYPGEAAEREASLYGRTWIWMRGRSIIEQGSAGSNSVAFSLFVSRSLKYTKETSSTGPGQTSGTRSSFECACRSDRVAGRAPSPTWGCQLHDPGSLGAQDGPEVLVGIGERDQCRLHGCR